MEYNELQSAISIILRNDWDPIGVGIEEEAKDEYQSYVSQIVKLKTEGASEETIAAELNKIANETMGMPEPIEHSRKIAAKIFAL